MIGELLRPDIEEMIARRDFAGLRDAMAEWEPADIAELLDRLEPEGRAVLIRLLPRDRAADTFEHLPPKQREELLRSMAREQVAEILNEMDPDDRTSLLEELPANMTQQMLTLLSPEERRVAVRLLGYPEESIGRLMTPDYVAVRRDWTVVQVLDHIRRVGRDSETLNVIYVVDSRGRLVDDLRIRELLLAPPEKKVSEIVDGKFVDLRARDDQETAVRVFKEYDRVALPVVDRDGVLLGIVTIDDVLDVAEEEATEDMQKMGGMEALDTSYMNAGVMEMVRKRAVWLVVLFFGQMLTANAMNVYQAEIAQALVLVIFLPLIISSGGNSGSQAAALVIRAMALGEVKLRDWWRVMRREILSGMVLGGIIGVIGFGRVAAGALLGLEPSPSWPWVALTVAAALVGVVLWGTLVGSMLPFVLRRLGADPAASSNPFVATFVDVTGLVIYFSLASCMLRGTLL